MGYRASVLDKSTNYLLDHDFINGNGDLITEGYLYEELLRINGIGPYSASHIAMLEHDYRHIPIDSAVTSYCKMRYGIDAKQVDQYFDLWGDYRFMGYKLSRILE